MTNYRSDILYKGNIVKNVNGIIVIEKENVDLMYDEMTDSFYDFLKVFNHQLDIAFANLTEKQKKEYKDYIDKHKYSYLPSKKDGKLYVDENTITIKIDKKR